MLSIHAPIWLKSRSGHPVQRPGSAAFVLSVCVFSLILSVVILTKHQRVPPETIETDSDLPAKQKRLLSSLVSQEAALRSGLLKNIQRKSLVWHARFNQESGHECHLFVFDWSHCWPGSQPITVVYTDARRKLLTWKEVGGQPWFTSATLEGKPGRHVLAVTYAHRGGPHGIHRYRISPTGVEPFGEIEWSGQREAEIVWKSGAAFISCGWRGEAEFVGDVVVLHQYDAESGLHCLPLMGPPFASEDVESFHRDFDERMRELVKQHGLPSWSVARKIKAFRLPASELVAILDSKALTEVEEFPHHINKHLLVATGPFSDDDWGSFEDGIMIFSRTAGIDLSTTSDTPARIYVAQPNKYPELVFIRKNHETLVAFTKDGVHIATATRESYYRDFLRRFE